MRYCGLRIISVIIVLLLIVSFAWAGEVKKADRKKYPHPHTVHAEAISPGTADFSVDDIGDWKAFFMDLQGKLKVLPFSAEARIAINTFRPDALNSDERAVIINEINKLLTDEKLATNIKNLVPFSGDTRKSETVYRKSRDKEDLKWLNRAILNDMFPQTKRKEKIKELKKITCVTCHEAYAQVEKEIREAGIDERVVMDCFAKAIKGEKSMNECVEKANMLKKSKIEDYGPLKLFIQRSNTEGQIPFFAAIHPEDPYTFKPLIKRLICLECHGQERKITKVKGRDGKIKEIPIFYGIGSEKRKHEHELNPESQKDEN